MGVRLKRDFDFYPCVPIFYNYTFRYYAIKIYKLIIRKQFLIQGELLLGIVRDHYSRKNIYPDPTSHGRVKAKCSL